MGYMHSGAPVKLEHGGGSGYIEGGGSDGEAHMLLRFRRVARPVNPGGPADRIRR